MPKKNILEEALEITSNDRNHDYGEPIENHRRTMKFWKDYLDEIYLRRTGFYIEFPLTEEDICWLNILQKIAREIQLPKRDNKVDTAGWARNVEMIEDGRQEEVPF